MKLRVIVADEDPAGRAALLKNLNEYDEFVEVVAVSKTAQESLQHIETYNPHLVFLDIQMYGVANLQILQSFQDRQWLFVLITAYYQYAYKPLKEQAFSYMLKPIGRSEFCQIMDDALEYYHIKKAKQKGGKIIGVKTADGFIMIKQSEIVFARADGNYSTIFLKNGKRITLVRYLKDVDQQLTHDYFFRIGRSVIINLNCIENYWREKKSILRMISGHEIELGREHRKRLEDKMILI